MNLSCVFLSSFTLLLAMLFDFSEISKEFSCCWKTKRTRIGMKWTGTFDIYKSIDFCQYVATPAVCHLYCHSYDVVLLFVSICVVICSVQMWETQRTVNTHTHTATQCMISTKTILNSSYFIRSNSNFISNFEFQRIRCLDCSINLPFNLCLCRSSLCRENLYLSYNVHIFHRNACVVRAQVHIASTDSFASLSHTDTHTLLLFHPFVRC